MAEKIRIGVTGAGGGVGQSVIKSLQGTDYEIVALDGELLGTGLYAAPAAYKIPYAKSESFIDKLLEICKREKINLLFPGLDAELKPLSLAVDKFKAVGTTVVVSAPDVIALSNDKLLTYQKLSAIGISVPKTFLVHDVRLDEINFPVIVKQRLDGARSKNVFLLKTKDEYVALTTRADFSAGEYVMQDFIDGEEFTCGSVNVTGKCDGVIVMKRVLRDGDTYKCFSVENKVVEEEVFKLMNAVGPFGACNVQLRVKDGRPYVFEINARCSGTTGARTLCGFNEPKMIADYLIHKILPEYDIRYQTILRYWQELVVDNSLVKILNDAGELHNSNYTEL